jgi:hypothetical protein
VATGDPQARNGSDGMIAANLLRTELSDQEIDELEDFLQGRCLPKGGMNISMLDGYLTAIVSMPEFVPPSHWLPRVWRRVDDGGADQEPAPDDGFVFASAQEEQRMTGFILRRMTEIMGDFEQARLQPIFLKATRRGGRGPIGVRRCLVRRLPARYGGTRGRVGTAGDPAPRRSRLPRADLRARPVDSRL